MRLMFRLLAVFLAFGLIAAVPQAPVRAEQAIAPADPASAEMREMLTLIGMDRLLPIMRAEGVAYADALEAELFPGKGGADWAAMIEKIYAPERMETIITRRFSTEMADVDLAPLRAFFDTERGQRIVGLEISAREALLDDEVEAVSRDNLDILRGEDDPRLAVLGDFIEENDLVETNIAGALNSNLAFYQGLAAGGALTVEMSQEDMLRDVWAQEPDIREETEGWVWSYLAMAYKPLKDEDITAYTALSRTAEGRALNAALFAAFDDLFTAISRDLGIGASQFMSREDI